MESLCLEIDSVTYQNEEKEAEPSPIKLCRAGTAQNEVRVHIFLSFCRYYFIMVSV
jgi:hypothetical protein